MATWLSLVEVDVISSVFPGLSFLLINFLVFSNEFVELFVNGQFWFSGFKIILSNILSDGFGSLSDRPIPVNEILVKFLNFFWTDHISHFFVDADLSLLHILNNGGGSSAHKGCDDNW